MQDPQWVSTYQQLSDQLGKPVKVSRPHRWVMVAVTQIDDDTAAALAADESVPFSFDDSVVRGPVCYSCETPYDAAAVTCPGDASE